MSDAEADAVHLEVILHPVAAALAAKAGLLDPAERRHFGRDDAGVHADDAVFQRFLHAGDAADVAGVESVFGSSQYKYNPDKANLVIRNKRKNIREKTFKKYASFGFMKSSISNKRNKRPSIAINPISLIRG